MVNQGSSDMIYKQGSTIMSKKSENDTIMKDSFSHRLDETEPKKIEIMKPAILKSSNQSTKMNETTMNDETSVNPFN
mgnify:CR=1 FL=1